MKCPNCGMPNLDSVKFCENCGSPLQAHHAAPEQPQQDQQPYPQQQPYPGYQPAVNLNDPYHGHSMKWYKFLVFFALIASAVVDLFNAFRSFTTGSYTVDIGAGKVLTGKEAQEWMYLKAPGLKTADIFYGIALILCAGLLFAAWYYLYKKKKLGPTLLYVSYACSIVVSAAYSLWRYSAAKDVLKDPATVLTSAAISAIYSIVMLAANVVYFKKRKDIFVN